MELKGEVKVIGETQEIGNNGFQKRELVLTMDKDGNYPQYILIEFTQDKVDLLDTVQIGNDITVHTNLRGRCWTNPEGIDKYFNSIQGWKLEGGSSEPSQDVPTHETDENPLPF